MADEPVNSKLVQLDQFLHGYRDGHRLIAGSRDLPSAEAGIVLALSDASGSNASIPHEGYLTGYPLPQLGAYAFARTWSAKEVSRPGCVWTHTLLVDFSDLALLSDLFCLTHLFRRPRLGEESSAYEEKLPIDPQEEATISSRRSLDTQAGFLRRIIAELYGHPDDCIGVVPTSEFDAECCVGALLRQQWPKLRRRFTFSTLSYSHRIVDDVGFDLQILPNPMERGGRVVRIPGRLVDLRFEPEGVTAHEDWLDVAVEDALLGQDRAALRRFLSKAGSDLPKGRASFPKLCALFRFVKEGGADPHSFEQAVALVQEWEEAGEAKGLRRAIADKLLQSIEASSRTVLEFIVSNLPILSKSTLQHWGGRLGLVLWNEAQDLFWLIHNGTFAEVITKPSFGALTVHDVVKVLQRDSNMSWLVFDERPDLFERPEFWFAAPGVDSRVLARIARTGAASRVLAAMIESGVSRLPGQAGSVFDRAVLLTAVWTAYESSSKPQTLAGSEWLDVATADGNIIANFLSSHGGVSLSFLAQIARRTRPDDIPNAYGEDPWVIALRASVGTLTPEADPYFFSYVLSRGLGRASRNSGDLIAFSLDSVYRLAAYSGITDQAWQLLKWRLPSGWGWVEWDLCQKIIAGIADWVLDRRIAAQGLVRVTKDDKLFRAIAMRIAGLWGGRTYLKGVLSALGGSYESFEVARLEIIKDLLDR